MHTRATPPHLRRRVSYVGGMDWMFALCCVCVCAVCVLCVCVCVLRVLEYR